MFLDNYVATVKAILDLYKKLKSCFGVLSRDEIAEVSDISEQQIERVARLQEKYGVDWKERCQQVRTTESVRLCLLQLWKGFK